MQRESFKKFLPIILALLIVGASFFMGFYAGKGEANDLESAAILDNKNPPSDIRVDFAPFWRAWKIIDDRFIDSKNANGTASGTSANTGTENLTSQKISQERVWGSIEGMVASLGDPYTVFFPPVESEIFQADIQGNFGGIGIEIGVRDGFLTVIAPLKNTPAYRAGMKTGDKILKINDTFTDKLGVDQAVKLIRGEVGTKVEIIVTREGEKEPLTYKITRAVIDIPTIDTELRGDGIFVIRLYNFSATSPNLFRRALRDFINSPTHNLILDLRGNPGGYLEAAVDMASWFLPAGSVIVKEDYKKNSEAIVHRSKGYDIFSDKLKMVILIDGGTASAAEILAGALKEHGKATLVGTNSFGKGSVQELIKLTADTSLKVTIAQWVTPNGTSISAGGLKPDVEVKVTEEDMKKKADPQLRKAVELLLKK